MEEKLQGGPHPTGSSTGPREQTGRIWNTVPKMPTRRKRKTPQICKNPQSPLTPGSSWEGCLLPQPEPSQAIKVLRIKRQLHTHTHTLTHSLTHSLINNVSGTLEPRVTFIHYPLEDQGAQTPKSWITGGEKKHKTRLHTQVSSLSFRHFLPHPAPFSCTNTFTSTIHLQTPITLTTHTHSPPNLHKQLASTRLGPTIAHVQTPTPSPPTPSAPDSHARTVSLRPPHADKSSSTLDSKQSSRRISFPSKNPRRPVPVTAPRGAGRAER
jgi:hypothetical protein